MTDLRRAALIVCLAVPGAGQADVLDAMAGTWRGSGWARESAGAAQETVRCRITNTLASGTLTVKGRCAVPGQKLHLAGVLKSAPGSTRISGHWFNPDGLGVTALTGVRQPDRIVFTVTIADPQSGAPMAQTVEWRIEGVSLTLRSGTDSDPVQALSDIRFSR